MFPNKADKLKLNLNLQVFTFIFFREKNLLDQTDNTRQK